jgi:Domain of unknown function (DUF4157)
VARFPVSRRSLTGDKIETLPDSLHETLAQPGSALDTATRGFLESRFDHDFSAVRVHTNATAAQSARAIDARAYTAGNDIAFAPGEYAPQTPQGRYLLAHELAHVTQGVEAPTAATVSNPGDAAELAADRAAAAALAGNPASSGPARRAPVARQAGSDLKLSPTQMAAILPSQGETAVQSFLRRMWAKQSDSQRQFRVTDKVREGLKAVFNGIDPTGVITLYDSADELFEQLKPKIPATLPPMVMARLDRLPNEEKKLPEGPSKPTGDPAKPAQPPPGSGPTTIAPEKPKGLSDAAEAALKEAFRRFSETELGKQLEQSAKSYVLSVEGIPFDVFVVANVLTFVAANDPKLPSSPDIPLGEGIKIKIEYSGRASDLPPLVRDLVHGHSTAPPGKEETKIGLSVEVTNDAVVAMAKAVGHFFAEAARWFAKGIVKIGDAISKAGINLLRALGAGLGGAALGGLIGGLAGGGLGAAIGAGAGFLVGAGASIIGDLISKKNKKNKKKEPAQ